MTDTDIKFYYCSTLAGSVIIFGDMAVAEYRGLVLPPAMMCVILAALASALVGDWLVQNFIARNPNR